MNEYSKIIFLDIDGVLQGYSSQKRFEHMKEMPALQKELSEKHNADYLAYDKYDVAAVYYDWDPHAVSLIKKILAETGAMIVISSDWRRSGDLQRMKDLFEIHGMGEFVVGMTRDIEYGKSAAKRDDSCFYNERTLEILDYVSENPQIQEFVAIDDLNLSVGLEGHFVHTQYLITDEDCDKSIEILGYKGQMN